jgi:hypothetical protein
MREGRAGKAWQSALVQCFPQRALQQPGHTQCTMSAIA